MITKVVPSGRRSQRTTSLAAAVDISAQIDLACTCSCQTATAAPITRKMARPATRTATGNSAITLARPGTLVLALRSYLSDATRHENVQDH